MARWELRMFHLDRTPEQSRRWEAEARQAASQALSYNARQIQLELADICKSLPELALRRKPQSSAEQGISPAFLLRNAD